MILLAFSNILFSTKLKNERCAMTSCFKKILRNCNRIEIRECYYLIKVLVAKDLSMSLYLHIIIRLHYVLFWNIKHSNYSEIVVKLSYFISHVIFSNPSNYPLLIYLNEIINMCIRNLRRVSRDTVPLIGTPFNIFTSY